MKELLLLLLFSASSLAFDVQEYEEYLDTLGAVNPEAFMDFTELCQSLHYPVESHWVTTDDGYILRMYRIGSKNQPTFNSNRIVIFLQHGLVDSSDTWIVNDEANAPGFKLANLGYDIWLGNSRGNMHSRNHTVYNPNKDPQFWDFTWEDMADYDVPAQINYVLEHRGAEKLVYIGHSQGTLQMFAHLSTNPEFADKLYVAAMLAPIGLVRHQTSEVLNLTAKTGILRFMGWIGVDSMFNKSKNFIVSYVCYWFNWVCRGGLYLISDEDPNFDNKARLDVIMGHFPCGTSTKNLRHFSQMTLLKTNIIPRYNYGSAKANQDHYDQPTPPTFDMSLVRANIGFFAGPEDRLADPIDVGWLASAVPKSSVAYYNDTYPVGHVTYLWGKTLPYFDDMLNMIENYTH